MPQHKTYGLTPRELEVVGCIVEGCSNRDIAKQFNLSEETVKRHLSNIFDKTGVSTRLELALVCHRASHWSRRSRRLYLNSNLSPERPYK